MGVATPLALNRFTPFHRLGPQALDQAIAHARVERLPPGRRLQPARDLESRLLFLVSGQLALLSESGEARILKAGTPEAKRPVNELCPLRGSILTSTSVTLLSIERKVLEGLQREAPPAGQADGRSANAGRNGHLKGDEDLTGVRPSLRPTIQTASEFSLQGVFTSPLFSRLPTSHLQTLKQRFVPVQAHAGEVILRQDSSADHYYYIASGRCRITRRNGRGRSLWIAEPGPGEGFGEGALIAHDCHDSTVTAIDTCLLLRLPKGEFLTLLVQPFIQWIPWSLAVERVTRGDVLLDIRSSGVFRKRHLPDSVNLPLDILRSCAPCLDRRRQYIVCGDSHRRAATAAFLLVQQGMDIRVLDENLRQVLTHALPSHREENSKDLPR